MQGVRLHIAVWNVTQISNGLSEVREDGDGSVERP